ncbi:MAG: hypothetical protein EA361_06860 [Bacteroidetes bacterium]|nr:MAG: hypothetical protein EA361_06860 [Bacteroidota bacterium]
MQNAEFIMENSDWRIRIGEFGMENSEWRIQNADFRLEKEDVGSYDCWFVDMLICRMECCVQHGNPNHCIAPNSDRSDMIIEQDMPMRKSAAKPSSTRVNW